MACGVVCAALVVVVMYALCYFRALPRPLYVVWFGLVLAVCSIVMNLLTGLAHLTRYLGTSEVSRSRASVAVCRFFFATIVHLNPQVRIHVDEDTWRTWANAPRRSAIAINHASFFDAFLFVGLAPWGFIYHCRTMMKSSLRSIPIFGAIFDRCGHFPVYFKSDADGVFSLDKDRQAPVMERVDRHINVDNGRVAIFPEGAVNKNPQELMPFRHGSFKLILDNKLPLLTCVTLGNDTTWPAKAAMGGLPADIYITVKRVEVPEGEEAVNLAERLRGLMQADLEALRARAAKEAKKVA